VLAIAVLFCLAAAAPAEVMLQWFESDWDEMYRRLPEVAQIGYDYMWIPPPTKGPTGKGTIWANVGYNLYDRFDLGDVPQRGSLATRYGTRGSLRNMVDKAHQCDIKIISDIVMNHNGNGPDFREYPGMHAEDFHVQWHQNYVNNLNYKRGPRMDQWHHGDGFGGTMWQELAQLIDIRTEDPSPDWNRFVGGNNTPGWNLVGSRPDYIRHVGQYERYPYAYTNELASEMLNRWIVWLGNATDHDGLRLDAGKHTPYEFFGWEGTGFLHEAHWNFTQRRGLVDDGIDELYENYLAERNDALIFAEILSPWSEIEYWFGGGSRNPMRFLDYGMKQHAGNKFNGDLNGLGSYGSDFGDDHGILYVWGHDEGGASKINLAYAYILTHIGLPMVYFTGNNITWENHGRAAYDPSQPQKNKTWMIPGYDSQALGDVYNDIPNLVWIHQQFAWGEEEKTWENDGDYFALERYDDLDSGGWAANSGEGIMIMALNDSGWDQTRRLSTSFKDGTALKDYTGHNGSEAIVGQDESGKVDITVPGNGGQGWVCYAPKNADPVNVEFQGSGIGTIEWVVPGGVWAAAKTNHYTRITGTNFTIDVDFGTPGGPVDSAMLKWGQGYVSFGTNDFVANNSGHVAGGFEKMYKVNSTNWNLPITITDSNIPEGLNVVKVRVFNDRTAGYPALFNTVTEIVYVDRRGPELDITSPRSGEAIYGDCVMVISNLDYTAKSMTFNVDGGGERPVYEIMKGLWKASLTNLSVGAHTITVTALEGDWSEARTIINTSVYARAFNVAAGSAISLTHSDGDELEVPFFKTGVTAGGSPSMVRLYWDGYELPFNAGGYSNVFTGEVVFRDHLSNVVTGNLWGAFVNGEHFFEAVRVDDGGTMTSRAVAQVTFDLYNGVDKYGGLGIMDSDGDAIPDNVEIPHFQDGAPGPDQALPGDDNDWIPEWGENWTRLNPYNHSTFYNGQWDDQVDSDGDGFSNYEEVYRGYSDHDNVYEYDIYDAGDYPPETPMDASYAWWTPSNGVARGAALTVHYYPEDGALSNAAAIKMHVGHSKKTEGEWQDVIDTNMTHMGGGHWQVAHIVPSNATSVDFTFWDGGTMWDGSDWQAVVIGNTNYYFTMDGYLDSDDYVIHADGMRIAAAFRSNNLYVGTWSTETSDDVFLYVTDELGDASDPSPGWNKSGRVFVDTATKPRLVSEQSSKWNSWVNVSGTSYNGDRTPAAENTLEGEISLVDAFGSIPEAVYIAVGAYATADSGTLGSQGPYGWDDPPDGNIDVMEFLRVPIASIEDDDQDGYFDMGKPQMWTVINGETNDANYGLRRVFLNELAGDTVDITVILDPNTDPGDTIDDVELFSNVNRRDFAKLPGVESPGDVSTASRDTYYRAYPMSGSGPYSCTVTINKCGAYRINARYTVNGGDYVYYTDSGLRRDTALVVSPKKALQLVMYELNPMNIEATSDDFFGRSTFKDVYTANTNKPDHVNSNYFPDLGVNMIWLQPIHPIGSDNRQIDPETELPYDPGSPYAVRNYWEVNAVLGDPSHKTNAMKEFQDFVSAMDDVNVGVMLDGTFNHSAWDCEIGQPAVDMFDWATNATDLVRTVRPDWYSRHDSYGEYASYYFSAGDTDVATAPDRIDFGKWSDAADFHFGVYDALVQEPAGNTNDAWSSSWHKRFLREEDRFEGFATNATKDLWEYFAYYPVYWMEQTGHPDTTPEEESYKGIDGLRCDFAQGLPNVFWEYCINKTRSVKWDFIFMAESLDGYRAVVEGSHTNLGHGVGYRSARHFDVLNENLVFYWRDQFFDFGGNSDAPHTAPTQEALSERRRAFDDIPILLNLTSHDEIYPSNDWWRVLYAFAELGAIDGVPMLFYGQEAGAQNDASTYAGTDAGNNFAKYETNFGKSIPNFKRYNHMTSVWDNVSGDAAPLLATYQRIGRARRSSPALQSQEEYFLNKKVGGGYDENIFAVAKLEEPGVSASTQDVVFVFVNNNYQGSTDRWQDYSLDADYNGKNWFGIEAGKNYNLVDLISTNPTAHVWGTDQEGAALIAAGITVGLTATPYEGKQAQYLKLIDVDATYPDSDGDGIPDYSDWDDDNDGLPDWYERDNGLSPTNATGVNGASGDKDGDGMPNLNELRTGTAAGDGLDVLRIESIACSNNEAHVTWRTKIGYDHKLQHTDDLMASPLQWVDATGYLTALDTNDALTQILSQSISNRLYRVMGR